MVLPDSLQTLLLERPWPLFGVAVIAALMLLLIANRKRDRRYLVAGGMIMLLAALTLYLAQEVVTPREQVALRTQQMLAYTAPLDLANFKTYCHPDVALLGPKGELWLQGPAVLDRLHSAVKTWPIRQQEVRSLGVKMLSLLEAQAQLDLATNLESASIMERVRTTWELRWRRDDVRSPWKLVSAQWITFQGQPNVPNIQGVIP